MTYTKQLFGGTVNNLIIIYDEDCLFCLATYCVLNPIPVFLFFFLKKALIEEKAFTNNSGL